MKGWDFTLCVCQKAPGTRGKHGRVSSVPSELQALSATSAVLAAGCSSSRRTAGLGRRAATTAEQPPRNSPRNTAAQSSLEAGFFSLFIETFGQNQANREIEPGSRDSV